jgi:hypothetical protein
VAAPTAPSTFPRALAANIGIVDLDSRSGCAKLVTPVPFDHRLHQLVLDPPGGIGRDPQPATQLNVGQALFALRQQMNGATWREARTGSRRSAPSDAKQCKTLTLFQAALFPLIGIINLEFEAVLGACKHSLQCW